MTNKRILFLALLPVSVAFIASNHRTRYHNTRLSESSGTVSIALTREKGKNEKLAKALSDKPSLDAVELPCIAHADGEDYPRLKEVLLSKAWDYVTVTSPEGAKVLASVCDDLVNMPPIAAVGKATEQALQESGLSVSFCPSRAIATSFVAELPGGAGQHVLYPASQRAQETMERGLRV